MRELVPHDYDQYFVPTSVLVVPCPLTTVSKFLLLPSTLVLKHLTCRHPKNGSVEFISTTEGSCDICQFMNNHSEA